MFSNSIHTHTHTLRWSLQTHMFSPNMHTHTHTHTHRPHGPLLHTEHCGDMELFACQNWSLFCVSSNNRRFLDVLSWWSFYQPWTISPITQSCSESPVAKSLVRRSPSYFLITSRFVPLFPCFRRILDLYESSLNSLIQWILTLHTSIQTPGRHVDAMCLNHWFPRDRKSVV